MINTPKIDVDNCSNEHLNSNQYKAVIKINSLVKERLNKNDLLVHENLLTGVKKIKNKFILLTSARIGLTPYKLPRGNEKQMLAI